MVYDYILKGCGCWYLRSKDRSNRGYPLITFCYKNFGRNLITQNCINKLEISYLVSKLYCGLLMNRNLGRKFMKTVFIHGAILWVCGERKWTFNTTTVTQILKYLESIWLVFLLRLRLRYRINQTHLWDLHKLFYEEKYTLKTLQMFILGKRILKYYG